MQHDLSALRERVEKKNACTFPGGTIKSSDGIVRMAPDASCRTFPGSVRSLVGRQPGAVQAASGLAGVTDRPV